MNKFLYHILVILAFALTGGCESEIDLEIDAFEERIVVEGYITSGQYARVSLTRNVGFFDPIDLTNVEDFIIEDAVVVITDGTIRDTCVFDLNEGYLPPVAYFGQEIIGQVNRRYDLEVYVDGKVLTATTLIPRVQPLDSLWWFPDAVHLETGDSVGPIYYQFSDPDTLGNNHRLAYQRIGIDDIPYSTSGATRTDRLVNGLTYESTVYRSRTYAERYDSSVSKEIPDQFRFVPGQRVALYWNAIDPVTYEFWQSTRNNEADDAFSTSQNLASNIQGEGGIGIWGGYAESIDTVYIP